MFYLLEIPIHLGGCCFILFHKTLGVATVVLWPRVLVLRLLLGSAVCSALHVVPAAALQCISNWDSDPAWASAAPGGGGAASLLTRNNSLSQASECSRPIFAAAAIFRPDLHSVLQTINIHVVKDVNGLGSSPMITLHLHT